MKPIIPLLLAATLFAACAEAAPGSNVTLGRVRGVVLAGPQCPVETLESPCPDVALPGISVQLVSGDLVVATTVSGQDGRFSFEAEPGSYELHAIIEDEPVSPIPFAKPVGVQVVANETVRADVLVDTGIR